MIVHDSFWSNGGMFFIYNQLSCSVFKGLIKILRLAGSAILCWPAVVPVTHVMFFKTFAGGLSPQTPCSKVTGFSNESKYYVLVHSNPLTAKKTTVGAGYSSGRFF